MKPIRIAGAGCCLLDELYPDIDFSSPAFTALRSRITGDGGLIPGRLSFPDEVERFLERREMGEDGLAVDVNRVGNLAEALAAITGGKLPAAENIGGPSAVSLIHAAQMLGNAAAVEYRGHYGNDAAGERLRARLDRTPLNLKGYRCSSGATPSTIVLSDPRWDGGRGERCFVNDIGVAAEFSPDELDSDFFSADVVALGGTALVPALHDALPGVLYRAKTAGALTIVNTVFDFRNERVVPEGAWPLGPYNGGQPGPRAAYENCDLLIADRDEALRLSGCRDLDGAIRFLMDSGASAFLVTRGGDAVLAWAKDGRFAAFELTALPVCESATERVQTEISLNSRSGDTTGCGDAFAGGVIAAVAKKIAAGRPRLDLIDAAGWGIAAGAATLFILGGTYYEYRRGEKRAMVRAFHADWLKQTGRRARTGG